MNKKISLALIIALVGFPQISETIYTPALPNVAFDLHTTASLAEATLTVYFIGFSLGVLLWGAVSDLYGRRIAMLAGIGIYGVASLLCSNLSSISALLFFRVLQAFGASVGSVITQTILRDLYEGEQKTKVFSIVSGALALSPAIGPLLGGVVSQNFGWRANFWVLGLMAVVLLIWCALALIETRPAKIKRDLFSALFLSMIRSRALWGHILLIGSTNGIIFGFYQEAPFLFIDQMGMTPSYYGLFGLLVATAGIVSAAVSFRCAGFSHFIPLGSCSILLGGALLYIDALSGLLFSQQGLLLAILALFLTFFGTGLIIPNSLSRAIKPFEHAAGSAGSIFGALYYLCVVACTTFMTILHDGTAAPLPTYILLLGAVSFVASRMCRVS